MMEMLMKYILQTQCHLEKNWVTMTTMIGQM